jgi:hypothetical protein
MRRLLAVLLTVAALRTHAATVHNDDSCDIATLPAATLLVPYFEVDVFNEPSRAKTTLFTITNTSPRAQIAAACRTYQRNAGGGNDLPMEIAQVIRFDEHENVSLLNPPCLSLCVTYRTWLPPTSRTAVSTTLYPAAPYQTSDAGGWMYLDLNRRDPAARATQNWVTVSMAAEGRFQTLSDATPLANGCTPHVNP